MSENRIVQAHERVIALLMRLSPQWTEIDTAQFDRLGNASLYLLCGAGLVELRFRGRAWTDQNALDVEVTASGVWIDVDRKSILPEEIRGAVPAWHGRAVAVEMQPVVQARLTTFGQEQQQKLRDEPQGAGLFVTYLCVCPVQGRVAVRLVGNEGPAPGVVRQDAVDGALLEALKDIATSIRDVNASNGTKQIPANTIIFRGGGAYAIGTQVVRVTESEDCVLQAFLEKPAMAKDQLIARAGFDKAVDVLRALLTKYDGVFAEAITMPGGRGRGGYRVQVAKASACN